MKDDLISRSALGIGYANPLVFDNPGYAKGWNSAVEIIKNAPAVDAVEVVRCRECKHCLVDLSGREAHLCMRMENGFPVRRRRKADDFCSYGERKDND